MELLGVGDLESEAHQVPGRPGEGRAWAPENEAGRWTRLQRRIWKSRPVFQLHFLEATSEQKDESMGRFSHRPASAPIRGASLFNLPNVMSFGVRIFFKASSNVKIRSLQVLWRQKRRQKNETCDTLRKNKCALSLNWTESSFAGALS